jgi:TM2 domain-containing membrane protein YozV
MKNKTTAALLAVFLGGIGVHRFYLGQTLQGIICILFCWTLVPGIIALIDFVIFLTMSEEAFDHKYNPA